METRDYELIFIMPPTLAEDEISEVEDTVTGWITSHEGEITKHSHWGRRRLAYPVQNYKEGYYILLEMKSLPESIKDIERRIRLYDPIIRHLVVRVDN